MAENNFKLAKRKKEKRGLNKFARHARDAIPNQVGVPSKVFTCFMNVYKYSSPSFERPLLWETTSFERPHLPGLSVVLFILFIPPLRDHLLYVTTFWVALGVVSQRRDYCIYIYIYISSDINKVLSVATHAVCKYINMNFLFSVILQSILLLEFHLMTAL